MRVLPRKGQPTRGAFGAPKLLFCALSQFHTGAVDGAETVIAPRSTFTSILSKFAFILFICSFPRFQCALVFVCIHCCPSTASRNASLSGAHYRMPFAANCSQRLSHPSIHLHPPLRSLPSLYILYCCSTALNKERAQNYCFLAPSHMRSISPVILTPCATNSPPPNLSAFRPPLSLPVHQCHGSTN